MIDYAGLRTAITTGLHEHLEMPIILSNQDAPKPGYPFLTYLPISVAGAVTPHMGVYTTEEKAEMLEHERQHYSRMTLSLTACSDSSDQAHQVALTAAGWFAWAGYLYLKATGIVVIRLEPMTNRDTLIVGDYERRVGFDAQLRVPSEVTLETEWIETVRAEGKGDYTGTIEIS